MSETLDSIKQFGLKVVDAGANNLLDLARLATFLGTTPDHGAYPQPKEGSPGYAINQFQLENRAALDRAKQQVGDFLGVKPIEGFGDNLQDRAAVLTSMVVPSTMLAKEASLGKNVLASLISPFGVVRKGHVLSDTVGNGLVGGGIAEGINAVAGDQPSTYTLATEDPISAYMRENKIRPLNPTEQFALDNNIQLVGEPITTSNNAPDLASQWPVAAGAVALALGAGAVGVRLLAKNADNAKGIRAAFAGEQIKPSLLDQAIGSPTNVGVTDQLGGHLFDVNDIITNRIKKGGPEYDQLARDVSDALATTSGDAQNTRTISMLQTGKLLDSGITIPAPVTMKGRSDALSEEGRDALARMLFYKNELEDRWLFDQNPLKNANRETPLPMTVHMSDSELQAENARLVEQFPDAAALADDTRLAMRGWLDFFKKEGIINGEKYQFLKTFKRNFIPLMDANETKTLLESMTELGLQDNPLTSQVLDDLVTLKTRNREVTGITDPFDAAMDYMTIAAKYAMDNRNRNKILDALGNGHPFGQKFVQEVGSRDAFDLVTRRGGELVRWKIDDPALVHALQFSPGSVVPLFNSMRILFQQGTTGTLNPGWAPVGFLYDVAHSSLYDTKEFNFTPLWSNLKGAVSYYRGAMKNEQLRRLEEILAIGIDRNNLSSEDIAIMRQQAKTIQNSVDQQVYALGLENGVFSKTFAQDINRKKYTLLENAAPEKRSALMRNGLFRRYLTMMNSLENAARQGFILENKDAFAENAVRAAQHARQEVVTDLARRQLSPTLEKFLSTVPYGRVGLVGTLDIGRKFLKNPVNFLTRLGTYVVMPTMMSAFSMSTDEKFRYYYWNVLTPQQRANRIYFNIPGFFDDPASVPFITLPGELTIGSAPTLAAMDMIFGLSSPEAARRAPLHAVAASLLGIEPAAGDSTKLADNMQAMLKSIASRNYPIDWPTPLKLGLLAGSAATTNQPVELNGLGVRPVRGEGLVGTDKYYNGGVFDATATALLSQVAGTASRSVINALEEAHAVANKTGEWEQGLKAFTGQIAYDQAKQLPFAGLLGIPAETSRGDLGYEVLDRKNDKIKQIARAYTNAYERHDVIGNRPVDKIVPEGVQSPEFRIVGATVKRLQAETNGLDEMIGNLLTETRKPPSLWGASAVRERNRINEQIQLFREQKLRTIDAYEMLLSHELGRSFTLDNVDLEKGVR